MLCALVFYIENGLSMCFSYLHGPSGKPCSEAVHTPNTTLECCPVQEASENLFFEFCIL